MAMTAEFPFSARQVPEYGDRTVREVIEAPYRLIYRLEAASIRVLTIFHSRRATPPLSLIDSDP